MEETKFICASEGRFLGNLYICDFESDRPLKSLKFADVAVTYLQKTNDGNFYICGRKDGQITVRDPIPLSLT